MSEKTENELGSVMTPDGKLKVINNLGVTTENREITLIYLEDQTIIINVKRFEENEKEPYSELITDQTMRLSKLTFALLVSCLIKANIEFEIDVDGIIAELNTKLKKEPYSDCTVCGEIYLNPEKDSDTCIGCRDKLSIGLEIPI